MGIAEAKAAVLAARAKYRDGVASFDTPVFDLAEHRRNCDLLSRAEAALREACAAALAPELGPELHVSIMLRGSH